MFISEPLEAYMCEVKATDEEIEMEASDFALRFGNLLRGGKTIKEAAEEMMNPKWIKSDLTRYNYSRLQYRDGNDEEMPLDDRLNLEI